MKRRDNVVERNQKETREEIRFVRKRRLRWRRVGYLYMTHPSIHWFSIISNTAMYSIVMATASLNMRRTNIE